MSQQVAGSIENRRGLKLAKRGFTLVELLVVIAIIGILMGLLFPAVQSVRGAARRTSCSNKLRQMGVGLVNYESSHSALPMGAEQDTGFSWAARILPQLEQTNIYDQLDFDSSWDSTSNAVASQTLPLFSCPSGFKKYPGHTDYCGISGSTMFSNPMLGNGENGVLLIGSEFNPLPIRTAQIRDGLSMTIMAAEGVAVTEINFGFWACGWHCFTHDDGGVNNLDGGYNEIASFHRGGANVVFADGSTHFLGTQVSAEVLGALCTRNGGEVIGDFAP